MIFSTSFRFLKLLLCQNISLFVWKKRSNNATRVRDMTSCFLSKCFYLKELELDAPERWQETRQDKKWNVKKGCDQYRYLSKIWRLINDHLKFLKQQLQPLNEMEIISLVTMESHKVTTCFKCSSSIHAWICKRINSIFYLVNHESNRELYFYTRFRSLCIRSTLKPEHTAV